MLPNIKEVTIQGVPQSRDADLQHVEHFEVETDAGNRYRVTCQGPPVGHPTDWIVTREADGTEVGSVNSPGAEMFWATEYYYKRAGARFSSGKQFDLWNAVQSLLE